MFSLIYSDLSPPPFGQGLNFLVFLTLPLYTFISSLGLLVFEIITFVMMVIYEQTFVHIVTIFTTVGGGGTTLDNLILTSLLRQSLRHINLLYIFVC